MGAIILSLLFSFRQSLRSRAAINAEILALRHQLLVLEQGEHRGPADASSARIAPQEIPIFTPLS
jgi:hypothetical protein